MRFSVKLGRLRKPALWALAVVVLLALLRLWPHAPLSETVGSSRAVYAQGGELLRLTLASDEQYRLWVPLDRISPTLVDAVLLYEDRRFYAHPGVNPAALARSAAHRQRRTQAGRLDAHDAARAACLRHRQPHGHGQDRADRRGALARSAFRQARDPRGVPQHRALRRQHRRRAGREPHLLPQGRGQAQPARGADARGDSAEPRQAHRRARSQCRAAVGTRTFVGAVGRARSDREAACAGCAARARRSRAAASLFSRRTPPTCCSRRSAACRKCAPPSTCACRPRSNA